MTTLTPELKQAIEDAGDQFVRLEDPQTRQSYVLVTAEVYESIRTILGGDWWQSAVSRPATGTVVSRTDKSSLPEGIRRSQEAFFRDLPELLKQRGLRGKSVAYHFDDRVTIGSSQTERCVRCFCDRTSKPGAGGG
jgi:hypothetical protein